MVRSEFNFNIWFVIYRFFEFPNELHTRVTSVFFAFFACMCGSTCDKLHKVTSKFRTCDKLHKVTSKFRTCDKLHKVTSKSTKKVLHYQKITQGDFTTCHA
jgi:hypothetical protein